MQVYQGWSRPLDFLYKLLSVSPGLWNQEPLMGPRELVNALGTFSLSGAQSQSLRSEEGHLSQLRKVHYARTLRSSFPWRLNIDPLTIPLLLCGGGLLPLTHRWGLGGLGRFPR